MEYAQDHLQQNQQRLDDNNYIFDGFMHRPFNDDLDGWRNEMLDPPEVVEMARQILDLYNEVNRLRRENWELRKGKHG
jgi:hypothetical protein